MAKTSKIQRIKGIEVKTTGKNVVTMRFAKVAYPSYFVKETKSYVDIKNDTELKQAIEREEDISYGGELIIPKGTKEAKQIKDAVDTIWNHYDLENNNGSKKRKINPYPIEDGDEKADELEEKEKNGDIYRGCIVIKINSKYNYKKNKTMFQTFNKFGKYMPKSNDEVEGYYVRVGLYIDYYDYFGNEGIKAYMNAVQFMDENPDAKFQTNYENEFEFEEQTEEEKQDAFEKAMDIKPDEVDELPLEAGITPSVEGDSDTPFA